MKQWGLVQIIMKHINKDALLKAAEIFKTPKAVYILKPENEKEEK